MNGPPRLADRGAAVAQSQVAGLVLLVSHAHNHEIGEELHHRPGSGFVPGGGGGDIE